MHLSSCTKQLCNLHKQAGVQLSSRSITQPAAHQAQHPWAACPREWGPGRTRRARLCKGRHSRALMDAAPVGFAGLARVCGLAGLEQGRQQTPCAQCAPGARTLAESPLLGHRIAALDSVGVGVVHGDLQEPGQLERSGSTKWLLRSCVHSVRVGVVHGNLRRTQPRTPFKNTVRSDAPLAAAPTSRFSPDPSSPPPPVWA